MVDVIDFYIFLYGIGIGRYFFGIAVGVFKLVLSFMFLIFVNWFFKKIIGYRMM